MIDHSFRFKAILFYLMLFTGFSPQKLCTCPSAVNFLKFILLRHFYVAATLLRRSDIFMSQHQNDGAANSKNFSPCQGVLMLQ
jgi:hypothetical protein